MKKLLVVAALLGSVTSAFAGDSHAHPCPAGTSGFFGKNGFECVTQAPADYTAKMDAFKKMVDALKDNKDVQAEQQSMFLNGHDAVSDGFVPPDAQ